jgi:hypothetical protein
VQIRIWGFFGKETLKSKQLTSKYLEAQKVSIILILKSPGVYEKSPRFLFALPNTDTKNESSKQSVKI